MGKITDKRLNELKVDLHAAMLNAISLIKSAGTTKIDLELAEALHIHIMDAEDKLEELSIKYYGKTQTKLSSRQLGQVKGSLLHELMQVISKYEGGQ